MAGPSNANADHLFRFKAYRVRVAKLVDCFPRQFRFRPVGWPGVEVKIGEPIPLHFKNQRIVGELGVVEFFLRRLPRHWRLAGDHRWRRRFGFLVHSRGLAEDQTAFRSVCQRQRQFHRRGFEARPLEKRPFLLEFVGGESCNRSAGQTGNRRFAAVHRHRRENGSDRIGIDEKLLDPKIGNGGQNGFQFDGIGPIAHRLDDSPNLRESSGDDG